MSPPSAHLMHNCRQLAACWQLSARRHAKIADTDSSRRIQPRYLWQASARHCEPGPDQPHLGPSRSMLGSGRQARRLISRWRHWPSQLACSTFIRKRRPNLTPAGFASRRKCARSKPIGLVGSRANYASRATIKLGPQLYWARVSTTCLGAPF